MSSARRFAGLIVLASACATPRATTPASPLQRHWDGVASCEYRVRVADEAPLTLDVSASCRGKGVRGLEADDRRVAESIGRVESSLGETRRRGDAFLLPHVTPSAIFRYRVPLGSIARSTRDLNLAFASGDSVLAATASFLLYPLPLDVGTKVEVRVEAPPGRFASALAREGDHFRLEAHEIAVGTYSAFGKIASSRVPLAGPKPAELELTTLDGELALDRATLQRFAKARAEAVATFYDGFPAERAGVMVLPVPGRDDVVFGKLLPESAPGVVLLVGSRAGEAALADDWVLVHELFHIGVPSFDREGKWFDEGLATYFEPIIRVRAGFYGEAHAWREFVSQMPRGLPALTQKGLEHAHDNSSIYWGGALFCLLADVAARQASNGEIGLEHGIRRVLAAGGRASEVWDLAKTLATADGAFAKPVLAPLAARFAHQPAPLDLDALFAELGVRRAEGSVVFDDAAPLAAVRRAIFSAARPPDRTPP